MDEEEYLNGRTISQSNQFHMPYKITLLFSLLHNFNSIKKQFRQNGQEN